MNNKLKFVLVFVVALSFIYVANAQEINSNVVNLSANLKNYYLEIARGNVKGQESLVIIGHDDDVGTTSGTIWCGGATNYRFPSTAEVVYVASSSASDTLGGVGTNNVLVIGLDENYSEIQEIVNLSGQTPVQLQQKFLRMNTFQSLVSGSTGYNVGTITLANDTYTAGVPDNAEQVMGCMEIGAGQDETTAYTIPAGKTFYLTKGWATAGASKNVEISFYTKPHGLSRYLSFNFQVLNYAFIYEFVTPYEIPEKTDMWVDGVVETGSAKVSAGYGGILIANT